MISLGGTAAEQQSAGATGWLGAVRLLSLLTAMPDGEAARGVQAVLPQIAQMFGADRLAVLRRGAEARPGPVLQWQAVGRGEAWAALPEGRGPAAGVLQGPGPDALYTLGLESGVLLFAPKLAADLPDSDGLALLAALGQGLLAVQARARAHIAEERRACLEILEHLSEGVIVYDAKGRMVLFNPQFELFYPALVETLRRDPSPEEVHLPDQAAAEPLQLEIKQVLTKHASVRPNGGFDQSLSDGRILNMAEYALSGGQRLQVHDDVTELKLAEQRLFNIVTGARVCVWEWNVVTGAHSVNENWARLLGYTLAELEPVSYATWRDRVHPDDLAGVERLFDRILVDDSVLYRTEYRLRHRDGHWVWVLDEGRALVRNDEGRAELVSGSQVDISEQKARETALAALTADLEHSSAERAKSERRLSDIVSVSDGWLWEMDAECRYILVLDGQFFNDGGVPASGLYGLTQEQWLAAHPDMLPGIAWDVILDALRDRAPFRDFVYRAPKSTDGVVRWRRMTGTPIFDEEGRFTGYRGVGSDVTELYLAKARAEEASRTKSMFLANMSHEIRTPLNGVLGMAEVLEGSLTKPDQRRMIGTIRRSGEALLTILNDILDMSKIEAGKMELEQLAFSPADIAERVEDLHRLAAEEKGLAFEVLLGNGVELPRLGDPYRVQQILHNLIGNAIKFTDHGSVRVKIAGRGDQPLSIEVRDTGIGMTPGQLLRIHDEFSQADSSMTRRFGGTGLGMAITRSLVDSMQGEIRVSSELGKGSCFVVTLPLAAAAVVVEKPPEPPQVQGDLKGVRILVADDNETNRVVLEMMLTQLGAEVVLANDGAAALRAWKPGQFDCILLDITMPGMSGPAALKKIRALEEEQRLDPVPVIAATANVMAHQVADYLAMGFDSCVKKPINSAALAHAIRTLVFG